MPLARRSYALTHEELEALRRLQEQSVCLSSRVAGGFFQLDAQRVTTSI